MPLQQIPINDLGRIGLIRDIAPENLPPNVWSDMNNMRMSNGVAKKDFGYSPLIASLTASPYGLFHIKAGVNSFWVYAGLTEIYGILDTTETEITRASGDYTGAEADRWNSAELHQLLILNNGVDDPQLWVPSLGTKLIDLTNWPASTEAKVIRAFKNFLIALGVTKTGTVFPYMVKWSHSADPGSVPDSWDETDPAKEAGETTLAETGGILVDCLPLGETNIIYKEGSTWGMQHQGGEFVFRFFNIFEGAGLLAQDCARNFLGKHFLVTRDDIVIHNGTKGSMQSIIDGRNREWLFNNMDSDNSRMALVLEDFENSEMMLAFPSVGNDSLDLGMVWNWKDDTWMVRDLPSIRSAFAPISGLLFTGDSWNKETSLQWDSESTITWAGPTLPSALVKPAIGIPHASTPIIHKLDDGLFQKDGSNYRSFVERKGLTIVGLSRDGNIISDETLIKMTASVWPRIKAVDGTVIQVSLGVHSSPEGTVTYTGPKDFTVGTDVQLDFVVTGRYLAIKFEETLNVEWELQGYKIELTPLGQF